MRIPLLARFLLPLCLMLATGAGAQPSAPNNAPRTRNSRPTRLIVRVSDEANVLSEDDKRRINAVCVALEERTDAQMAVATVRSLGGQSIKEYANDLFRREKIGQKGTDKGVLILNVVDERRVRIEVGYGLEGELPDGKATEILRTQVAPFAARGEIGAGLYAGAVAAAQAIDPTFTAPAETLPASPSTPNSVERIAPQRPAPPENFDYPPASYPTPNLTGGRAIFALLGLLVFLFPLLFIGGIVWFFTAAMRRPLRCSKCRAPVQQLSETAELSSLSPIQQFEQRIGARDYRVWRCEKCHHQDITAHDLPYSQWVQCPTCRNQTASTLVETTREATPWQGGMERVILSCQWLDCKHASFYNRPTAPLSRGGHNRGYGGNHGGGGDLLTGVILGSILNGSSGGWNSGGGFGGYSGNDNSGGGANSDAGGFDGGFSDFGGGDSGGGGGDISY